MKIVDPILLPYADKYEKALKHALQAQDDCAEAEEEFNQQATKLVNERLGTNYESLISGVVCPSGSPTGLCLFAEHDLRSCLFCKKSR